MTSGRSLLLTLALASALLGALTRPALARLDEGRPACDYCRMIITEKAFGVSARLDDGRTMIFDAVECAAAAALTDSLPARRLRSLAFTDHDAPHRPLPLARTVFLHCPAIESPMGQSLLAVSSRSRATATAGGREHTILDWKGVLTRVNQVWFQGKQPLDRALQGPPSSRSRSR